MRASLAEYGTKNPFLCLEGSVICLWDSGY